MGYRIALCLAAACVLQVFGAHSAQAFESGEATDASSNDGRFVTPTPSYPSLVYGDTHQWTARVAFDERGNATEAVVIRSTGSGELDNLISNWIRGHWKSRGGKPTSLVTSAK